MESEHRTLVRRLSLACGVLFLITYVTSITALALFQPVLDDPAGYIAGAGQVGRIILGVVLELALIGANIGTAVVLIPLFRRTRPVISFGFLAARIVESTFIGAGILFVLGIVSLRSDDAGAASMAVSLAALKDWTFLLGPGITVGIGNGLILGYLLYRSGLVPRRMALLGIIGGPVLVASGIAVLFGAVEAGGVVQSVATAPEFVWELFLGVYLTVRCLRMSPGAGDPEGAVAGMQPAM